MVRPSIICIQKQDDFTTRSFPTCVAGSGGALVFLSDKVKDTCVIKILCRPVCAFRMMAGSDFS
jgi:hypothetical protein